MPDLPPHEPLPMSAMARPRFDTVNVDQRLDHRWTAPQDQPMNRASTSMHLAWAGTAVLLVTIALWLIVAAGFQRGIPQLMPLPEGPAYAHATTQVASAEPVPLPGGYGHLALPTGALR